jgi:signal transduction histidine kinase
LTNVLKDRLRDLLLYMWEGPTDFPRSLKLEWRLVAIRWLSFVFLGLGLPLANLTVDRQWAAYALLFVATIYNLVIQRLMVRYAALFAKGYLTMLGDSLLVIAMVSVGGGFDSPFYYILFTVTIAAAMRYGYGPSVAMALLYIAFDGLERLVSVDSMNFSFALRSGFLGFTAVLASYLREQAERAEAALQERLRQASLLNEATAMLGASLEFEPALHAAAAAASHLFGNSCAVLQPSARPDGDPTDVPAAVHCAVFECRDDHRDLAEMCRRYAEKDVWRGDGAPLLYRETLPSGRSAIVFVLALPTRRLSLATLGLSAPAEQGVPSLDSDILDSFVERVTLAIENASLYRTLASRSTDLQRAYADLAMAHQELLSVDDMKTNFLANVSHELRTPLTSIRGLSELLLTYNDEEVRTEFLQIINSESERLTRLVNDVLDIAKIEAGRIEWHMETLDLAALLRETARTYAPLIKQQDLAFAQSLPNDLPPIYGDRDRLQQVISNLLNNAMKFTKQGQISLGAAHVGEEIHVFVSDTGMGIPSEYHEQIFEKFQQVGAMLTDKPKGTGLGLAICRELVAHHGGRMWVESEPGVGSTFAFSLAIQAQPVSVDRPALVAA